MFRHLSLRWRLLAWMLGIFLVIQLTLSMVVLLYGHRWREAQFVEQASLQATHIARQLATRFAPQFIEQADVAIALAIADTEGPVVAAGIYDEHGLRVAGNEALLENLPESVILAAAKSVHLAPGKQPGRPMSVTVALPDPFHHYTLRVHASWTSLETAERWVRRTMLWSIPIGILAAGVGGMIVSSVAVSPFATLTRSIGKLAPNTITRAFDIQASNPEIEHFEEALEDARRRLAEGYAAQERFVANVSHELRTPVAVLMTEAQTLQTHPDDTTELRGFVHSVEEEMRRLGRMIDGFLTLIRIQQGMEPEDARKQQVNLNDVLLEAAQGADWFAQLNGVRLRLTLDEGDAAPTVEGEASLLTQMAANLIRNAIRFSPRGEAVDIRVASADPMRVIQVEDRGPGIPPQLLDTLFDRFQQAPDEAKRGRGSGLGLAIAQSVAELHGGSIGVCNQPAGGCCFRVELPAPSTTAEDQGGPEITAV